MQSRHDQFQLVLSEFEAQSKVAKVPSHKHGMRQPGASFLLRCEHDFYMCFRTQLKTTPAVFAVFFRGSSSIIHVVASVEVFVVAKVVLSP